MVGFELINVSCGKIVGNRGKKWGRKRNEMEKTFSNFCLTIEYSSH
jgi:hypothetical protein